MSNKKTFRITYKNKLADAKPYFSAMTSRYAYYLYHQQALLHSGHLGIYLSRKVQLGKQSLYFPFIDVDGDGSTGIEQEKTHSAIINARLTLKYLQSLSIDGKFVTIATGGTGFRILSNVLIEYHSYKSFIELVRNEMPHISDLKPTEDMSMPHQLFVYKGNKYQNKKQLVPRHSVIIPNERLLSNEFTPADYLSHTQGKPDPEEYISFMQWFLDFKQISDLSSLGEFGSKLKYYNKQAAESKIHPFNSMSHKKKLVPMPLIELQEQLKSKGIISKIDQRGHKHALSFTKLPCPKCEKKAGNAYAYPPYYKLYCHMVNCPAHKGMPLVQWSGIANTYKSKVSEQTPETPSYVTINKARELIKQELANKDNVLMLATPGSGKSYAAQEYLANLNTDEIIIYSSFNKALQKEAYDNCLSLAKNKTKIHLLQSKADLCTKNVELKNITDMGYSPSEILCGGCADKSKCKYYIQRSNIQPGVYFVTHPMLQYLKRTIPDPAMVILDEDILSGFKTEVSCTEAQFRTIWNLKSDKILSNTDYILLDNMLELSIQFSKYVVEHEQYTQILNSRKITDSGTTEDSIVEIIHKQTDKAISDIYSDIQNILNKVKKLSHRDMFYKGVDYKVIDWLHGIVDRDITSFIEADQKCNIIFKSKKIISPGYYDAALKILDATGNKELIKTICRRDIREVKLDIDFNSNKTHITYATTRSDLRGKNKTDLKRMLKEAINEVSGNNVLILTYLNVHGKPFTNYIQSICTEIDSSKTYKVHHFQGPRGINDYQDCDSVIVLGLPYPNLTDSYHDAYILFPDKQHEDLRDNWNNLSMNWELTQCIHRARPIHKLSTDLVVISRQWPTCLSEPDNTIEITYNKDWFEQATQRLEPLLKEYGLLTQDMGILANVYLSSKSVEARSMREKLKTWKDAEFDVICSNKYGELSGQEEIITNNLTQNIKKSCRKQHITNLKLINPIIIYRDNLLKQLKRRFSSNVLCTDLVITLSNNNQFTDILNDCLNKNPHYCKFSIKHPFSRNQPVHGIGLISEVQKYYTALKDMGILDVDLDTLEIIDPARDSVKPIPDNYAIVLYSDKNAESVHIYNDDHVNTIDASDLHEIFQTSNIKLITNNGKRLAKALMQADIKSMDIHDIVLTEKIINNPVGTQSNYSIDDLLKAYGLTSTGDIFTLGYPVYELMGKQLKAIKSTGLQHTYNLEHTFIETLSGIEQQGIQVNESIYSSDTAKAITEQINDHGIYHDQINQMTVSGRMSSKLHSMHKSYRSYFRARPGYTYIIADYKQYESRVLSALSYDANSNRIFSNGKDIYEETAIAINKQLNTSEPITRDIAKKIVLGMNNMQSAWSIGKELFEQGHNIHIHQVDAIVNAFYERYSDIPVFFDKVIQHAKSKGVVRTHFGRTRKLTGHETDNAIVSHVIQGTAADLFKLMLIELNGLLAECDAHIVHTMHDEVIVEVIKDQVSKVDQIIQDTMGNVCQSNIQNMSFPVDIESRDTWGKTDNSFKCINLCKSCSHSDELEIDDYNSDPYCLRLEKWITEDEQQCEYYEVGIDELCAA